MALHCLVLDLDWSLGGYIIIRYCPRLDGVWTHSRRLYVCNIDHYIDIASECIMQ